MRFTITTHETPKRNFPVGGKNTLGGAAGEPPHSMPRDYAQWKAAPSPKFRISRNVLDMNLYNVYFVSKGTGPQTAHIESQNSAGAKSQVEARYPGAYNITLNQLPRTVKRKSD